MRRWLAIDKALHFDILFIESIMQEQSHQHWIPSQKVCIDEGIGPWKGKNKGVKTYILGKPHPNGIKIYILADENNYVYDFWIYCGIQPSTAEIAANFVKKKKKRPGVLVITLLFHAPHTTANLNNMQERGT